MKDPKSKEPIAHSWITEDGSEFFVTESGNLYEKSDVPEDDLWEAGPEIGMEILRLKRNSSS